MNTTPSGYEEYARGADKALATAVKQPHEEISVKWKGFGGNLAEAVAALCAGGDALADVILVAGDACFPAHRLVLSANSPLFRGMFERTRAAPGTAVVLHDVEAECVRALLVFMYRGEVRVAERLLPRLLRAAAALCVRGLSADRPPSQDATAEPPFSKKRKKHSDWIKSDKKVKEAGGNVDKRDEENVDRQKEDREELGYEIEEERVLKCEPPEPGWETEASSLASEPASPLHTKLPGVLHGDLLTDSLAVTHTHPPDTNPLSTTPGKPESYTSPSFPCPFCPRVYNSWGYRRRHLKSRHRTNKLSCKWCVCELESTCAWYGHTVSTHGAEHAAARDSLVVLVEAHTVLRLPTSADPSPAALLQHLAPLAPCLTQQTNALQAA